MVARFIHCTALRIKISIVLTYKHVTSTLIYDRMVQYHKLGMSAATIYNRKMCQIKIVVRKIDPKTHSDYKMFGQIKKNR